MKQTISQALELPGHCILVKSISKNDLIKEANQILDSWEAQGFHAIKDVPDGEQKKHFKDIMRMLRK